MAAPQQQPSTATSAAGVSGPGSAGGPGPQQQPQPPTQLVGPAQSGLLQQQQQDFDPVQRYKMLIPQLKESLQVIDPEPRGASRIWPLPRGRLAKERS
jgi:mediator of RNA polymerase II transcription subunit 29